jgi:hypothetical protein
MALMIRAKGRSKDRNVMIVGLSDENLKRLQEGQPILTEMDDVGFPQLDLVIMHGKTEDDLREDLMIITRGQTER